MFRDFKCDEMKLFDGLSKLTRGGKRALIKFSPMISRQTSEMEKAKHKKFRPHSMKDEKAEIV